MSSLKNLPQINFADKSTQEIESAVITTYEAIASRTLAPGDPVRLFLEAIAAIITQQRVLIDYSAKQNLLAYSAGDYLEHIGVLVGTYRLPAAPAMTTLRFTLSEAQAQAITIPAGTRATPGNNLFFATTANAVVLAGQTTVDVEAACTVTGVIGNGYQAGQINKIVDPFQWFKSVSNTTLSEGGADQEDDDAYRERIRQAPEQFSVAGPDGAYQYWAKTASQSIIDVSVFSPAPGEVEIRPLLTGGAIPGQEILDAVDDIVNDKTIRPLTDSVSVLAPAVLNYNVTVSYWIDRQNSTSALAIQQAVTNAVTEFVTWQKSKLGRSVNPSELIARMMAVGAKRVAVTEAIYTALHKAQVAIADQVAVTYGGLEDG